MIESHSERLQRFIKNHLPLMVYIGTEIELYDGSQLILKAPLTPNTNDKGTGFGGSLYCLCVLNAIGLVFLKCFEKGINPDLVVGKAGIQYHKPVYSDPITSKALSPQQERWGKFFEDYNTRGKAGITINSTIVEGSETAVSFEGQFALVGESDTTL